MSSILNEFRGPSIAKSPPYEFTITRCYVKHAATEPFAEQARITNDINYYGTARVTNAFVPIMPRGSKIINVCGGGTRRLALLVIRLLIDTHTHSHTHTPL
jgi:NAD(P)-dependent dehydrogenase (short-subunit alcohol dehydrogenase family)